MNKIIVRIKGGLGNQLFSYAAMRRLALNNNVELVIDNISGFSRDHDYRRNYQLGNFNITSRIASNAECLKPFSLIRRYLLRVFNRLRKFENRTLIEQKGVKYDNRLLNYRPHGSVYIEGYWQSERYFKDIETVIRDDLKITPPTDKINIAMAARIQSSLSVAVHVRFFDMPDDDFNDTASSYYRRAIERMEKLTPNAVYFIFSDQPDAALEYIPLSENRIVHISHNKGDVNAYADLWLMTQCKHFIIANSTFSWWGAWLSENEEKYIISPKSEISGSQVTAWGFEGLLPDSWLKI